MSLLVAQLQNQDPTQPTDGVQFLQQLTDISSLEQLLDIHTDLDKMSGASATSSATGSAGASTSGSGTQGSSGSNDPSAGSGTTGTGAGSTPD
jgi:flagellar basal-body rod modification protein FlgD